MNSKVFFGILILVAGMLAGWFMTNEPNQVIKNPNITTTPQVSSSDVIRMASLSGEADKGGVKERMVVTYTDAGFSPVSVSIARGGIVTFVNESTRGMWVASGVHPTHQLLPGFDQLKAASKNGTYEYTFEKVGTWQYHNHLNPTDIASVVVSEK